jgi:cell division protein ZapA
MGELSIKIKILDREYPMKVKLEDEARIRAVGKTINDRLRFYAQRFKIDDKQDLLAMVAFDSLIEKVKADERTDAAEGIFLASLDDLHTKLDEALG